jgi:hypothetical protein
MAENQLMDKEKFLKWLVKEIEVWQNELNISQNIAKDESDKTISHAVLSSVVHTLIETYTLVSDGKFDYRYGDR